MISEKDIDLIDNFLNGSLADDEIKNFNIRLKNDIEFAKEFELINNLKISIASYKRDKLKKKLEKISKEYHKSNSSNYGLVFKIAASILIIFGVSALLYYTVFNKPTETKILSYKSEKDSLIMNFGNKSTIKKVSNIEDNQLGFVPSTNKTRELKYAFINNTIYQNHYILTDSILYFLYPNQVEPKLFEDSQTYFIILENQYFNLSKFTKDTIVPLVQINDSLIIKQIRLVK